MVHKIDSYKCKYSLYTVWYLSCKISSTVSTLQWCRNERDGVSNHRLPVCLLNRLFWCRWKKILKLRATGLCEGNQPVIDGFPSERASNAENVSIWWPHHDLAYGYVHRKKIHTPLHNEIMTWNIFPHYLPFVRGIEWLFSLTKGEWYVAFFLVVELRRHDATLTSLYYSVTSL